MNMYSRKIEEEFIKDILKKGFYADKEILTETLREIEPLLNHSKDKSLEEIITILFNNLNNTLYKLTKEDYQIPGYHIEIMSDFIRAILYDGVLNETKTPMPKNALFDIASITKLATQIISYNLIKEGYYNFDDKIKDLHPKFKKADNLDVKTIMNFSFSYNLDGQIEKVTSIEDAKKILYTLGIREKDTYTYIDLGMNCLKEVMEYVTKKSFDQLFQEYIVTKLNLKDTYLTVPKDKLHLITGTPNAHLGKVNDMKAIKLGGISGHAGILASSKDLLKIVKNLYVNNSFFPQEKVKDVYTQSEYSKASDDQRGIMGNACCTIGGPFVDYLSPLDASAYQGSTRTQINIGTYNDTLTASSILLNPASTGLERAEEIEKISNKKFVTKYHFEGQDYVQMATQTILPVKEVVKPLTKEIAKHLYN